MPEKYIYGYKRNKQQIYYKINIVAYPLPISNNGTLQDSTLGKNYRKTYVILKTNASFPHLISTLFCPLLSPTFRKLLSLRFATAYQKGVCGLPVSVRAHHK